MVKSSYYNFTWLEKFNSQFFLLYLQYIRGEGSAEYVEIPLYGGEGPKIAKKTSNDILTLPYIFIVLCTVIR